MAKTLLSQKEVDAHMLKSFKEKVLPSSAISTYAELIKMGVLEWLGSILTQEMGSFAEKNEAILIV